MKLLTSLWRQYGDFMGADRTLIEDIRKEVDPVKIEVRKVEAVKATQFMT